MLSEQCRMYAFMYIFIYICMDGCMYVKFSEREKEKEIV